MEQKRKGLRALPYTALVTLLWTHASDLQDVWNPDRHSGVDPC